MPRPGTFTSTFRFDGKRHYAYGKTQREADRNAAKKLALLETGKKEYNSKKTVEQWSGIWLKKYKAGTVGDAWYKAIIGIIDNYITPAIGDKLLTDVKPMDIKEMYNRYSYLSESHGKKLVQITRQIFDSAEENDLIDKSPARHVKPSLWAIKGTSRTITDEERRLTLQAADECLEDGLFFLIMLYCGLRPQETAVLKMGDYDKKSRIIHVRRARKADGSIGSTKSESGYRDVPVPEYLADRLDTLKKKQNEYIITSATGKLLTKTSQKRMWQRFKRRMDIANGAELFRNAIVKSTLAEDLEPYCYRHTYCTDLQDAGVPVTVAKVLMGHSDITMTANIYTHHSEKNLEDARQKIEEYQNSLKEK